jgi:hypothetical protein
MDAFMASRTQCDQVLFQVATRMAPELKMMYLQVQHAAADLASPVVPLQYLAMQRTVSLRVKSKSLALDVDVLHEIL